MSQSVARLLIDSLEAHGVDRIFCVPGESYVGFTSALIEDSSIQLIVCRHESGAGYIGDVGQPATQSRRRRHRLPRPRDWRTPWWRCTPRSMTPRPWSC